MHSRPFRGGSFRVAIIADRVDIEPLFSPMTDLVELIYLQDFVARANVKATSDVESIASLIGMLSPTKEPLVSLARVNPLLLSNTRFTIVGYAEDLVEAQQYLSLDNLSSTWDVRVVIIRDRLALVNYRDKKVAKLFEVLPASHNIPRPCRLYDNDGEEHDIPAGTPVEWKNFNRTLLDEMGSDSSYVGTGSRFDLFMVKNENGEIKVDTLRDLRHRLSKERHSVDDIVSPDATVFFFGDSLS